MEKPKIDLNKRLDMHSPEVRAQLPPQMREDWEAKQKERGAKAVRKEARQAEIMEDEEKVQQVQTRIQQPSKASNPVMIGEDFERVRVEAARLNAERKATEDAKKEAQQPSSGIWGRVKKWFG